jgi:Arc/MetJ-type ribon-helix-helix transcriptional regulator
MNILLTVDQTDFVQTQLESGQFSSPEEVIAIALEMMASSRETHDSVWLVRRNPD